MIKIAHIADVHWRGLSRHEEYRKCFEEVFQKLQKIKPDVIVVAGDIVHSKTQGITPELINCLTWWFKCLGEITDTHVTLGNHDGLILNSDREDAISPIVKAINHPRIHLHKKSGTVSLKDGYNLCVFSCFDEEGWKNVSPVQDEVNIATFHGAVAGSKTDEGFELEGETTVDFFKQFDFVLLGDIHKLQYLDEGKRIAYPGSTIQQNYGESKEKGFLLWAIDGKDDYATRFVPVSNDYPFVTLDYKGKVEDLIELAKEYPTTSRFRIRLFDHVSAGETSKIKSSLKANFTPSEIVFKQESITKQENVEITQDFSVDSFEDVHKLVMDYYSSSNLSEKKKETMKSFLKDAWFSANIDEAYPGGKFHIKKMEFDNTFGYGEGNVINFDSAEGITGIFGKNASGKSSICGTLAYGLYNGTDRGSLKNLHIVNTRKNFCNVKLYFSKSGIDYVLERQTVKYLTKKGDLYAPTDLNLFEIDPVTGQKKDMSEEQRRETEKILRDLVGNLDDFLLTSLSSQGNVNKFIDLNAAARKAHLAKFLKLDTFDKLNDMLKDELNSTKKMLDSSPEKQFETVIEELQAKIESKTKERESSVQKIDELKITLDGITKILLSQSGESFTASEISDQESVISGLEDKIEQAENDTINIEVKKGRLEQAKKLLEQEVAAIDSKVLLKKKEEREDLNKRIGKLESSQDKKKDEIDRDKVQVKNLSDVPCGSGFADCKYIINAKSAKTTLEKKQDEFNDLKNQISSLQKNYNSLLKDSIDEKLAEYQNSQQKLSGLSLEIGKVELESSKLESKIETLRNQLLNEEKKLDNMKANVCDDTIHDEREKLVEKKKSLDLESKKVQAALASLSETIGTSTTQLAQTKREKEEFEIRSHKNDALKLLNKALSKNGIPLSIVRKRLPQINSELSRILQTAVGFTIELESDEESNDMEIYINYGDSRRIIECGSGMEKMMSSIAIRAALTNLSSLPKADVFIIDEGFGALDGKNLESCASLLRELTKYFKSIVIISHVDGIKDVVDNVIEVGSKGKDSHVHFN
jgi:DNA repair exonuclease SbcCD ATPase subunit